MSSWSDNRFEQRAGGDSNAGVRAVDPRHADRRLPGFLLVVEWMHLALALNAVTGCTGDEPFAGRSGAGGQTGAGPVDRDGTDVSGLDARPVNSSCHPPLVAPGNAHWANPFPDLPPFDKPVALRQIAGDATSWFVVEQAGRVHQFEHTPKVTNSRLVLDITDRVVVVENGGLLGLAFHPRFADTPSQRFVFAFYTAPGEAITSRLSRFRWPQASASIDPNSEEILIAVQNAHGVHLNDDLHFGPDGYLYASMGDGGPQRDRFNHAQDPFDLRGKIWRIDVDAKAPYGIPKGNPYASGGGAPEVFARGLRNPFRFGFDSETGQLYAGDVGFDTLEEVNRIEAGGNYGWNCFEGTHRNPVDWNPNCPAEGLIAPLYEYNHGGRVASVTGGRVYRGSNIPALAGKYVFGDFATTNAWALDLEDGAITDLGPSGINVVDFAQAPDGELYVTDVTSGTFRKLVLGTGVEPPGLLSESGCFERDDPSRPLPALIPFDVRAPSWSDGAQKRRWMALPDDAVIHIETEGDRSGDFTFPPGTVLIKELSLADGTRVETRFFVRHPQGDWSGYSYQWKEDQSDATLLSNLPDIHIVQWGDQTWEYPNRGQCFACHSSAAGRALGPEAAQLNSSVSYPQTGRSANQLVTLAHIGVFDSSVDLPAWQRTALTIDDSAPLEERSRAVLHSNCAPCHRPDGPGRGPADFRFGIPLSEMKICNVAPAVNTFGIDGARLLAPGSPERSILLTRMARRGTGQMPPLATRVVDHAQLELLEQWVLQLENCGAPAPILGKRSFPGGEVAR